MCLWIREITAGMNRHSWEGRCRVESGTDIIGGKSHEVPAVIRVARFGAFELDPAARELRKSGTRIRLQHQPFQLLAFLVMRAGDVVTREELRHELWPGDTFVDFDKGLNTAMKKVRAALAESAAQPRFIETLPRVGYRFIAPVQTVKDDQPVAVALGPYQAMARPLKSRRRWVTAALLVAAATLLIAFGRRLEPGAALRAMPLTSYPGVEIHPAFSPGGEWIAFAWNGEAQENYDIYVKDLRSAALRRLTSDPADDVSPSWSPDGRSIAYVRLTRAGGEVHVVSPHGGASRKLHVFEPIGPRLLSVHDVLSFDPGPFVCWSSNSEWLIMPDRDEQAHERGLCAVSVSTGEKRMLTRSSLPDAQPALSPDGRTLAFVRAAGLGIGDIYLLPVSPGMEPGAAPRKLVSGNGSIQGPAWSPDGSELFFVSGQMAGRHQMFRITVGGASSRPKPLTLASERVSTPAFPKTAPRLAFSEESADRNIWRLRLDAAGRAVGRPERILRSTYLEKQPQFSPDGSQIVFASSRAGSEEIWIAKADGSEARQITRFGGAPVGSPRWSHDGEQILFDAFPQGSGEIYIVPAHSGPPLQLTQNEDQDFSPSWSRDGRSIYFISKRGGRGEVWKLRTDLPAQAPVRITTGGASSAPFEAPGGKFVYYLKGTELWRVPSEGGAEQNVTGKTDEISAYALGATGVYLVTTSDRRSWVVRFLSLVSEDVKDILSLEGRIWHMALSPAEDVLLYMQAEHEAADLMLVEPFR